MQLNLSISNGPPGNVQVILQGQSGEEGGGITVSSSTVTLSSSNGQQLYTGSLTNLSGERRWRMTALLTRTGTNKHSQLQVQIDIRVDASGQVAGTIAGGSAIPAGSGTSI